MDKLNCWEYMRCGREVGGHNHALEVCPTAIARGLHKTHGGMHGGRACWIVAGTMCGGRPQGTFAEKFKSCTNCDFFKKVKSEEKMGLQLPNVLLKKLGDDIYLGAKISRALKL